MKESHVPKRQYTEEYKLESVRLAQSVGINVASRRLGVPSATLGNWKRRYERNPVGLVGTGPDTPAKVARPVSEQEAENSRLRKELASARLDIEILGKATAYFAKGSR